MNKAAIRDCVLAMTQNRILKVQTILKYAGDEFESNDDLIDLAKDTDEQLNVRLNDIANYFLNELD